MLQNAYFLEKTVQIASVSGDPMVCLWRLGALPPDPHVVTSAYYYSFVEFIFIAKCVLLP